jgi:mannitol/fructose-specific phosphotransferase system IIA component (Ntr-type)
MKSLSRLVSPDRIVNLSGATKLDCLKTLTAVVAESAGIGEKEAVLEAILEREKLLSTGFGLGLAIPHAKLKVVKDFVVGIGIHRDGVPFDSLDEQPVHILVMILGPDQRQDEYLKVLSRVTNFLKDKRDRLLEISSPQQVYELTFDY